MSHRTRLSASLRRRHPRFKPLPRILVVCEGDVTEPSYLREFSRQHRDRVLVVFDGGGGAPKTLVERAVALKREAEHAARQQGDDFLRFDEVWCVFDVDVHPNIPDARQQARDNAIRLAVSNPCFELWLLLHFQDQTANLSRGDAQGACRNHMPRYKKVAPYEVLGPLHEHAIRRARALDLRQTANGDPGGNPSTGVYRLIERIRAFG